jgi:hypothetical protein
MSTRLGLSGFNLDKMRSLFGGGDQAVVAFAVCGPEGLDEDFAEERAAQCLLLKDLLGNPSRPVALDPASLTPDVLELARTIYDGRAFDRMPILADALEDSGCDDSDILNHCREPGPHSKGCWVIDLVLGKS